MSELPESVLGTVQARLAALAPETRRVLRAASIFGERFAEEGRSIAGPKGSAGKRGK